MSPEKPLHRIWEFWFAVGVPVVISAFMVMTTLPYSHSFSWSTQGFNEFWESARLPVAIFSLSIPFGTIIAVMHRSSQSARQISIAYEQSKFKNFFEHRASFIDEMDEIAKKYEISKRDLSHLYSRLFKHSIDYDYRPSFPEEWLFLYNQLERGAKAEELGNMLEIGRSEVVGDLQNTALIEQSMKAKIPFITGLASSIDKSLEVLRPPGYPVSLFDIFDINEEEDVVFNSERILKNCKDQLEVLQEIIDHIFTDSFVAHFSSDEQKRFAGLISSSSISYSSAPEFDIEFLLGKSPPGLENIYRVSSDGEVDNGRLVVLSFSIIEDPF